MAFSMPARLKKLRSASVSASDARVYRWPSTNDDSRDSIRHLPFAIPVPRFRSPRTTCNLPEDRDRYRGGEWQDQVQHRDRRSTDSCNARHPRISTRIDHRRDGSDGFGSAADPAFHRGPEIYLARPDTRGPGTGRSSTRGPPANVGTTNRLTGADIRLRHRSALAVQQRRLLSRSRSHSGLVSRCSPESMVISRCRAPYKRLMTVPRGTFRQSTFLVRRIPRCASRTISSPRRADRRIARHKSRCSAETLGPTPIRKEPAFRPRASSRDTA